MMAMLTTARQVTPSHSPLNHSWARAEPICPLLHIYTTNIMTTATLIAGKVKYAASTPKDFGHGERINIVISPITGGDDIKVWGSPNDAIATLTKGQQVTLMHDGKTYKLVETSQPTQLKQPVANELSADQKRAIALYVNEQADLLKFCWVTASEKLDSLASNEESIRCAASCLYIAAQRKFGL